MDFMMNGVPMMPDWMINEAARQDHKARFLGNIKAGTSAIFDDVPNMPAWMKQKAQQLDVLLTEVSMISATDVKMFPEARLNQLKKQVDTIQQLHQELKNAGITNYCTTKDQVWSVLDTMSIQEVNQKLDMIRLRSQMSAATAFSEGKEVVDVSQELPTDNFEDENPGSFW